MRGDTAIMGFAVGANVFAVWANDWSSMAVVNMIAAVVSLGIWIHFRRQRREIERQTRLYLGLAAPRPQGVQVVRADGQVLDCELVFLGYDEDGWQWQVAGVVFSEGDRLLVEEWPPHTGIEIQGAS